MKFLRYNLWKARRQLNPAAVFRRSLERRLNTAWNDKYGFASWYRVHLARLASAGTIGVLIASSFGTGAYAYVSPEVTEQSALYPIKQKLEAVEEKVINRTPEAKVQFYFKQIARREAEAAVLVARGVNKEVLEERIEKVEEKLMAVSSKLAVVASERRGALESRIQARVAVRRERLQQQAAKLVEQLARVEDHETSAQGASAAAVLVSTTVPDHTAVRQSARREERQEKIRARLKAVQERLEQLPGVIVSSTIGLPATTSVIMPQQIEKIQSRLEKVRTNLEALSTSTGAVSASTSANFLRPIRRLEQIREQLKHRVEQLDQQLERRLEKLDERAAKPQVRPASGSKQVGQQSLIDTDFIAP